MNSGRSECVTAVTGGGGSEDDFWEIERYVIIGRSLNETASKVHMKDPAKGGSQAIGRNTNKHNFLPIGDTPINVYIERKLRVSRF